VNLTLTERSAHRSTARPNTKIVEYFEGHYEAQEAPFGMVYKWCPERVVVECECGERATLTNATTTCVGCQIDYAAEVEHWLRAEYPEVADEALYPWRCAREREDVGLPF